MIFVATDHNFKNISMIPKVIKEQKIIIRDTAIDNEVRSELLRSGKIIIQMTLENKTSEQRAETIVKLVNTIYVFVNDIATSENRFFLKYDNVVLFTSNMEKVSFLKSDFQNEKLIENYSKKEQSVQSVCELPKVCNVAIKKKPLPRKIKMIE